MTGTRQIPHPDAIDTPAYPGNSAIRLIAHWHYGHDSRYTEVIAHSTEAALRHLIPDMPDAKVEDAKRKLGRPNDVFSGFPYGGWSWYWLVQVWAWDDRPAAEVVAAQQARAADPAWSHWRHINSTL